MDKKKFKQQVGQNIRAARIAAAMTQEELAEKVDLSASFLSRVENGMSMPSVVTIGEIAESLDILPEKLLEVTADYAVSDNDEDRRLMFLITKCTVKEKVHLCKYISSLMELRADE